MKPKLNKLFIYLFFLGIIFSLIVTTTNNFSFKSLDSLENSKSYNKYFLNNRTLKFSKISEIIHIDNNWSAAKSIGICTGLGIFSNPYIIKDLLIDGGLKEFCISIENSNEFFRIENCTTYNAMYGIKLRYVYNSQLFNNNCSSNQIGIYLFNCENNTISYNTAKNNTNNGIYLSGCNQNTITDNFLNNNYEAGIRISATSIFGANNISTNTIENNNYYGILLTSSYNTTIFRNNMNANNLIGISLENSHSNIIYGNTINNNNENGIFFEESSHNKVIENIINYNYKGILLSKSDFNTILSNNLIGNDICWEEIQCEDNIFENNNCIERKFISWSNFFFLFSTLIVLIVLISNKLKDLKVE